jgi:hypothetical protein
MTYAQGLAYARVCSGFAGCGEMLLDSASEQCLSSLCLSTKDWRVSQVAGGVLVETCAENGLASLKRTSFFCHFCVMSVRASGVKGEIPSMSLNFHASGAKHGILRRVPRTCVFCQRRTHFFLSHENHTLHTPAPCK